MTVTITNPDDPSQTYTYGRRGKKPNWVKAYEKTHGVPEKSPAKSVEADTTEHEITQRGQTLHNKTLKTKYTLGKRGRKPAWVVAYLAKQNGGEAPKPAPKKTEDITEDAPRIKRHPSGLREWAFRHETNVNAQGIVVAKDETEAMAMLNKCTTFPYTPVSFGYFWNEVEYEGTFKEGYWRFKVEENEWYRPAPKKIPETSTIKE